LAYVKGVTSAVQTQMDTKKAKIDSVSAQTGAYTLALADADKVVTFSKGTADTITIPLNAAVAFPTGTEIVIENIGVGTLTIAITATGTLQSKGAKVDIITFGVARLRKTATNTWILSGDLS
jgi:alpha-D-ribose 1-methylphosphonate 5-triphosphate synthase subunit PhnH